MCINSIFCYRLHNIIVISTLILFFLILDSDTDDDLDASDEFVSKLYGKVVP